MTAFPTSTYAGATYNSRGAVGDQGIVTNQYLLMETFLHELFGDLLFYNEAWMEVVNIPEKMNEVVHWEMNERNPLNAVWQIGEHGLQTAGFNSIGGAQTLDLPVPGQTTGQTFIEAKPKRYASIAFYTVVAKSVSRRNRVQLLEQEMGKVIAEQLDTMGKGLFDVYAQDLYPTAADTIDNDVGATDYFGYVYVIKLETYVRKQKLNPPAGQRFPVILPLDAQAGLNLDSVTQAIMRDTAARGNAMAAVFQSEYIGSLRCFDFFSSNRLTTTTNATAVNVGRGYIYTKEAIASLAMSSDEYGQRPKQDANSGPQAGMRAWKEEMPRPVNLIHHEPGSAGFGADPFKQRGALAETHTLGLMALRPGFLIRFMFAATPASDIGIGRAGTAGEYSHRITTG